jgi:hypothetical protein
VSITEELLAEWGNITADTDVDDLLERVPVLIAEVRRLTRERDTALAVSARVEAERDRLKGWQDERDALRVVAVEAATTLRKVRHLVDSNAAFRHHDFVPTLVGILDETKLGSNVCALAKLDEVKP